MVVDLHLVHDNMEAIAIVCQNLTAAVRMYVNTVYEAAVLCPFHMCPDKQILC